MITLPLLSVILLATLLSCIFGEDVVPLIRDPSISFDQTLTIQYDPPNGFFSPSAIGIFVRASNPDATIYYAVDGNLPTSHSPTCTSDSPYIQLNTPFGYGRLRNITIIATAPLPDGGYVRSKQINLHYYVEGSNRPSSYAFLVPGVDSGGYFIGFGIEMNATARAQSSGSNAAIGGQEFADFFADKGVGTYKGQVSPLHLVAIDPDLTGFEGGFAANTTDGEHYGFLVPFYNGRRFHGKIVRVDLIAMIANVTSCLKSFRIETLVSPGHVRVVGSTSADTCIVVLDVESLHPHARGFRKGFVNYPYAYLAPGEFEVAVRFHVKTFSLQTVNIIDLSTFDKRLGGYSGGFSDGDWSCYCPFRTFVGPIGGMRSDLPVDANQMRAFYHGLLTCIHRTAWEKPKVLNSTNIKIVDMSILNSALRGFSEAVRVGRYAYLAPLATDAFSFASNLIRIDLGDKDVGKAIDSGANLITILDLSAKDPRLKGFSGIYNIGQYVILVPARNYYEPKNGQRGHGILTRINMNSFNLAGINFVDLPQVTRMQTPSFNDVDLRGFSGGFANGMYGLLVPFYNGIFNGKAVRYNAIYGPLDVNMQELDLTKDRSSPDVYKGYRGGFVSLWQAVFP